MNLIARSIHHGNRARVAAMPMPARCDLCFDTRELKGLRGSFTAGESCFVTGPCPFCAVDKTEIGALLDARAAAHRRYLSVP